MLLRSKVPLIPLGAGLENAASTGFGGGGGGGSPTGVCAGATVIGPTFRKV